MKKIKILCLIMFFLGILFCIYGWLQSLGFSVNSDAHMKRTARHYVFLFGGGGLMFISWTIDKFVDKANEEIISLYDKISQLERKLDRKI